MMAQYYQLIATHYGNRVATRSQVPLLHHIDEGLVVLRAIAADELAMAAFCAHPLMQNDDDLLTFASSTMVDSFDARVMLYAMEYRKSANAYLCRLDTDHFTVDDIPPVPLAIVRQMLIADKVQNRKDFERYHLATHARSAQLDRYFRLWLEKLGIDEARYQALAALIR